MPPEIQEVRHKGCSGDRYKNDLEFRASKVWYVPMELITYYDTLVILSNRQNSFSQ